MVLGVILHGAKCTRRVIKGRPRGVRRIPARH
jgi:DNA-directed RNA polymerase subunit RPC12/RpoP